ncbi:hypothetical protein [Metabacillus litoralis]
MNDKKTFQQHIMGSVLKC